MLPTKLTIEDPESLRVLYKVVRIDTLSDVPGLVIQSTSNPTERDWELAVAVCREVAELPDELRPMVAAACVVARLEGQNAALHALMEIIYEYGGGFLTAQGIHTLSPPSDDNRWIGGAA